MNGSADCELSSPLATDEEPPGPLDLSSSILSTDFAYDAEIASIDTAAVLAASSWTGMTNGTAHNGNGNAVLPFVPCADEATSGAAENNLSFLRRTTSAKTRAFRRLHFPDVSTREWNDWRWQTRHRIRTLAQLEKMLNSCRFGIRCSGK